MEAATEPADQRPGHLGRGRCVARGRFDLTLLSCARGLDLGSSLDRVLDFVLEPRGGDPAAKRDECVGSAAGMSDIAHCPTACL